MSLKSSLGVCLDSENLVEQPKRGSETSRVYPVEDGINFISKAPYSLYFLLQVDGNVKCSTKKSIVDSLNNMLFIVKLTEKAFPSRKIASDTIMKSIGCALWELSFYDDKDRIRCTEAYRTEIHNRFAAYKHRTKKAILLEA